MQRRPRAGTSGTDRTGSVSPMTDLGDPRYVRFTNFKRDGTAVSTPVWFARHGDEYVFTSNPDVGKVKRLRRDPAVEIAESDVRGRVRAGAPVFGGTARLLTDADEIRAAERTLARKYGVQWRLIGLGDTLRSLVGRRRGSAHIAVRLDGVTRSE